MTTHAKPNLVGSPGTEPLVLSTNETKRMNPHNKMRLGLAFAALGMALGASAQSNVLLNKPVMAAGSYYGADLSTIDDGIFLPAYTPYYDGAVYWLGTDTTFTIPLGGVYTITQMTGQFDDNDEYLVQALGLDGFGRMRGTFPT